MNTSRVVLTALTVFGVYTCMYAFRKPITAATFENIYLWSIHYKVWVISAQVLGYLISKLVGIVVISALKPSRRIPFLIACLVTAELALTGFALAGNAAALLFMLLNGFALGFVWGIVFSFIEGRRVTDVLAVFLSITFIVSSGWVKTIGRYLIVHLGIPEVWMPAVTGAAFIPALAGFIFLLTRIPPPNDEDRKARQVRVPMNSQARRKLYTTFAFGLTAVLLVNLLLTVIREIKDNYLVEIFLELSLEKSVFIYSRTESFVGLAVLSALSLLVFVRTNRYAFAVLHFSMFAGLLLMVLTTWLFIIGKLDAFPWIVAHGTGMYLAYSAFQSLYFERFIATFGIKANVGYLIYLADFVGYLASCGLLFVREFSTLKADWVYVLTRGSIAFGFVAAILTLASFVYFTLKLRTSNYEA